MPMKQKKIKTCKHDGGRGYWSNLPGSVCLKCGKEVITPKKKTSI